MDGKCPSCMSVCSSDKLGPNIAIREVVIRFQEARPKAMELARADKEAADADRKKKRKLEDMDMDDDEDGRHTRSRTNRSRGQRNGGAVVVADSEDDDDDDFLPDGMVKCPMCNKGMKEELVYNHLDVCKGPDASRGRNTRSGNSTAFPAALQKTQKDASPPPPPTRLSQFNYAMLKENALRKKLQEAGIPSWGSKDLMKRRHIEWLNIHNSNCDAEDNMRKNKKQLLRELEEWERTQGGRAETKESKIMKKDFDGQSYAKSNKSEFDLLIARARQKRETPKTTTESSTGQSTPAGESQGNPPNGTDISYHQPPPNHGSSTTPPPPLTHPYENNESALTSIRARVAEANLTSPKASTLASEISNGEHKKPRTSN
ncbi:RAD18, RING-finger-containing E3 ubiquitin ligase [Pyrenophora tritici-repentis]|nr:RAD18, RING-finger-containing E3 ubiquitin ligase [Pyrenophora tritici-repentis]